MHRRGNLKSGYPQLSEPLSAALSLFVFVAVWAGETRTTEVFDKVVTEQNR